MTMTIADVAIVRAVNRLSDRLARLEAELDAGEDRWAEYCQVAVALAQILPSTVPGANGRQVTRAALAEQLGVSAKTLSRRQKAGELGLTAPSRTRALKWKNTPARVRAR